MSNKLMRNIFSIFLYVLFLISPVVASSPVSEFYAEQQWSTSTPFTVHFVDLSSNSPTSWFWGFGDDSSSTDQNPNHTYTEKGDYSVSLTVTNADGTDEELKLFYIHVGQKQLSSYDLVVPTPMPTTTFGLHATQLVISMFDMGNYTEVIPTGYTDMMGTYGSRLLMGFIFMCIFAAMFIRFQDISILVLFACLFAGLILSLIPFEWAFIGQGFLIASIAAIIYALIKGRFR